MIKIKKRIITRKEQVPMSMFLVLWRNRLIYINRTINSAISLKISRSIGECGTFIEKINPMG
jgi:hypothetical protein